ncbi:MAG: radical SAM protein [Chloracidobacterium sp.]
MTTQLPPRPPEGVVMWNLNTTCNYRCSYCTQRFLDDRTRWARDTPRFLEGFRRLPGRWEIKLSGGEPFLHPTLMEVVAALAKMGHRVSVVTNFSASVDKLDHFLAAAGSALRVFSASLHREYVSTDEALAQFLEKARYVLSRLPAGATFNVTCVATRANLPELPALAQHFAAAGVRFKVQPEKQNRDVIPYTVEEQAQLVTLGGHNDLGVIAPSFEGQPCWAGALAFTLDDRGAAWRCYPARRYRREYLGNFLDSTFQLYDLARPCQYAYCNCTVPIERGMMASLGRRGG